MTRVILTLVVTVAIATPFAADAHPHSHPHPHADGDEARDGTGDTADPTDAGPWWSPWYLVDYGLIAIGVGMFAIANQFEPRSPARFGPSYDPDDPTALLDDRFDDTIGHSFARRRDDLGIGVSVPSRHVFALAAGSSAYLVIQEGIYYFIEENEAQRFHDTMIGLLETITLNGGLTEFGKVFVGRLRPDFQARLRGHLCGTDPPDEVDCTDVDRISEAELADGRKSFPSGHSSFGMNIATYTTLAIGGRWVWGPNATPLSRGLGILLQTMSMLAGGFVAVSRIDDGRHHATDVMVGAALGFGLANFSYWRRFSLSGHVLRPGKRGEPDLVVTPGPGGAGAGLTLRF